MWRASAATLASEKSADIRALVQHCAIATTFLNFDFAFSLFLIANNFTNYTSLKFILNS